MVYEFSHELLYILLLQPPYQILIQKLKPIKFLHSQHCPCKQQPTEQRVQETHTLHILDPDIEKDNTIDTKPQQKAL